LKNDDSAQDKCEKAVEILKGITDVAETRRKLPEVIQLCLEAAKMDSAISEPYLIIADICLQLDCPDEALALLKTAREIEPNNLFLAQKFALVKNLRAKH